MSVRRIAFGQIVQEAERLDFLHQLALQLLVAERFKLPRPADLGLFDAMTSEDADLFDRTDACADLTSFFRQLAKLILHLDEVFDL